MDKGQWRLAAKRYHADSVPIVGRDMEYCRNLLGFLEANVRREARVVIYDAMPGEVDLSGLVNETGDAEQRFGLTRTPTAGYQLSVHPIGVEMETHRYGYRQPVAGARRVDDGHIGAVLVPGLAFDRSGGRLGHGMGYYDRFLSRLDPGVLRIGITGDLVVEALPVEDFDVAMTHLAVRGGVAAVPLSASDPVELTELVVPASDD